MRVFIYIKAFRWFFFSGGVGASLQAFLPFGFFFILSLYIFFKKIRRVR